MPYSTKRPAEFDVHLRRGKIVPLLLRLADDLLQAPGQGQVLLQLPRVGRVAPCGRRRPATSRRAASPPDFRATCPRRSAARPRPRGVAAHLIIQRLLARLLRRLPALGPPGHALPQDQAPRRHHRGHRPAAPRCRRAILQKAIPGRGRGRRPPARRAGSAARCPPRARRASRSAGRGPSPVPSLRPSPPRPATGWRNSAASGQLCRRHRHRRRQAGPSVPARVARPPAVLPG